MTRCAHSARTLRRSRWQRQSESEIFFEALGRNDAAPAAPTDDGSDELLARFVSEIAVRPGSIFNLIRWDNARTIKELFVPPVDYRYPRMG